MPWSQVLTIALGLIAYPGALLAVVLGLAFEVAAAWALVPERGGLRPAARSVLAALRPSGGRRGFPVLSLLALVLACVAAIQVAAPFNPVAPADRNLITAAVALVAAAWLVWTWGWNRGELQPRLTLPVQACWLVALYVPAVIPQNLHPQVLGTNFVAGAIPLKLASILLYLCCLPVLLHLLPESAPQGVPGATGRRLPGLEGAGFGLIRIALWVPYCGLFASLFITPGGDDLGGTLRFLGVMAGSAAISVAIAVNLIYRGAEFTRRFYLNAVVPFAWVTIALGMLIASIGPR